MRMGHCILTAVANGSVLTVGVPRVAAAMVFSAVPETSPVSFGVSKARNGGRRLRDGWYWSGNVGFAVDVELYVVGR